MAAPRRQLGAVILASLPLIGSSERSLMATRGFEGSLVQLSEGMVSSDTLLQFVLVVIALATAMGFVLGLWCASRFPGPPAAVVRSAARTLGTQSQCTYKRHWATPRFYVLPPASDGVFIDGWEEEKCAFCSQLLALVEHPKSQILALRSSKNSLRFACPHQPIPN